MRHWAFQRAERLGTKMRYEAGFGRECIFLIFGSVVQITGIERENVSTFHTGRCGEPDRSQTSIRAGHVGCWGHLLPRRCSGFSHARGFQRLGGSRLLPHHYLSIIPVFMDINYCASYEYSKGNPGDKITATSAVPVQYPSAAARSASSFSSCSSASTTSTSRG